MIDLPSARRWLLEQGLANPRVEALTGDVSPRRYFRIREEGGGEESRILAGYPPELAHAYEAFLKTTAWLTEAGVRVPKILATETERRWMLLEDLGEQSLFDRAGQPWDELLPFFQQGADVARRVSALDPAVVGALNPRLDREALWRELEQTFEVVLLPEGLVADEGLGRALEQTLGALCRQIGGRGLIPCHRDLMARNLVPTDEGTKGGLAVLDHQDLRLGPPFYDLASLLNDSLFPDEATEEAVLRAVLTGEDEKTAYQRAAVQRAFKAVGTFGAFARRGFNRHLALVPPTLERALLQMGRLPETWGLAADLRKRWRGAVAGSLLD